MSSQVCPFFRFPVPQENHDKCVKNWLLGVEPTHGQHCKPSEMRCSKWAGGSRSLTHAGGPLRAALLKTFRCDACAVAPPSLLFFFVLASVPTLLLFVTLLCPSTNYNNVRVTDDRDTGDRDVYLT